MKALILAGDSKEGPLKEIAENKAFIKICGKEMIIYVIEALRKLDFIEQIAVVGNKEKLSGLRDQVDLLIEQGESLSQNIMRGAEAFEDDDELLVMTSDIPMITEEALRNFIEKARQYEADLYYPIVRKEDNELKFPGVHRTYVKLKDGTFTGGNVFLVKVKTIKELLPKTEAFLTYRKKPWKLANILGLSFVVKFFFGALTINQLERRVLDLFNIKGKAIISEYPEIGTDVDKPSDLELASKVLS